MARIVAELPETTEPTPRNWRVRKKLIVWERPLRKADYEALGEDAPDGDILGAAGVRRGRQVRVDRRRPGVYFTTPHFDGYPMVLVRLAEISEPDLTELDHRRLAGAGAEDSGQGVPGERDFLILRRRII